MQFRSTNHKYTHYQGDIVSNVDDSSHGVKLSGGTTGGFVESVGDETNIALTVRAKGAGPLTLGDSSNTFNLAGSSLTLTSTDVNLNSTRVEVGTTGAAVYIAGSTAPFAGMIRANSSFATPNFNSTNAMVMTSTITLVGVNSSHYILANPSNLSTDCSLLTAKVGSTANSVNLTFLKASTLTVAATTGHIRLLAFRF